MDTQAIANSLDQALQCLSDVALEIYGIGAKDSETDKALMRINYAIDTAVCKLDEIRAGLCETASLE